MALKVMSLKGQGQLTTAKEVVEQTGGPFDATARVMQIMAHHGLLKSEQGAHGGYLVAKDLSKVSFHEFSEMILGPIGLVRCLLDHDEGACELHKTCNVRTPFFELNRRLVDFYRGVTLHELLRTKESASRVEGSHEAVN